MFPGAMLCCNCDIGFCFDGQTINIIKQAPDSNNSQKDTPINFKLQTSSQFNVYRLRKLNANKLILIS